MYFTILTHIKNIEKNMFVIPYNFIFVILPFLYIRDDKKVINSLYYSLFVSFFWSNYHCPYADVHRQEGMFFLVYSFLWSVKHNKRLILYKMVFHSNGKQTFSATCLFRHTGGPEKISDLAGCRDNQGFNCKDRLTLGQLTCVG